MKTFMTNQKNKLTKIKKRWNEDPESVIFGGLAVGAAVAVTAFSILFVKEYKQEKEKANEQQAARRAWIDEELSKGNCVISFANGYDWSFDPFKPMLEKIEPEEE